MISPTPQNIPNETTVQDLSNHYLLSSLHSRSAWIYCPTRQEEIRLGYDASLQNGKTVLLQYKSLSYAGRYLVSIRLDQRQLATLLTNFPQRTTPYLYYGFCDYRSYRELDNDFLTVGSPEFFRHMLFIDIHSLAPNTHTIRRHNDGSMTGFPSQQQLIPVRGPRIAQGIRTCTIGTPNSKNMLRTLRDRIRGFTLSVLRYVP